MTAPAAIPYERQSDPATSRKCGAACLSMVYRSLGQEVPQDEIWPLISKQNQFGSLAAATHLMAAHALGRGFRALAFQARRPLQVLRICREQGIRAILNHRMERDSAAGHYSVLVDIDDTDVVLHDPLLGPRRRIPHAELLELWQPGAGPAETQGSVLIAVAAGAAEAPACETCRAPMPSFVLCPKCGTRCGLQPAAVLSCVNNLCPGRLWNYLCCPRCDFMWSFTLPPPHAAESFVESAGPRGAAAASAVPPGAMGPADDPWNLSRLFAGLDKFCNHVLSMPAAASHPDIKRQLDFIAQNKEKLKLAQAEEQANRKIREEQIARLNETVNQNAEAHRKKVEELSTPSPPLDGDALAEALLKNLGMGT